MNERAQTTHVQRFTDAAGNELVSVALGKNGKHGRAIFDAADWDRWIADGHSDRLHFASNGSKHSYVRTSLQTVDGKRCRAVARILLGVTSKRVVHYFDDDHRNLRRSNLWDQGKASFLAERQRRLAIAAAEGAL